MDPEVPGQVSLAQFILSLPDIGGGLRSRTVDLDPALAQQLYDSQGHNRPIKRFLVERLARDIQDGRWQLNAQPILVDSESHLGDGQHRCLAVIKAQATVPVVVTFGIAPTAFATLDSGRSRSPTDMLFVRGEKSTGNLSRALNLIFLDQHGFMRKNRWSEAATNSEREQLLKQFPEIRDSVARCAKAQPIISPGTLAYVHWRGRQIAERAADNFVEAVITGAKLAEDSAAHVLRETLLRNKSSRTKKLQYTVILAYTIKAFNVYAKNEPMHVLSWKQKREGFPEFVPLEPVGESQPQLVELRESSPILARHEQPESGTLV
jgi:hypothetical protein